MTEQEAIKILHPDTTREAIAEIEYYAGLKGREAGIKAVEDAIVIACEALEKQIPKKPITYSATNRADCPQCGNTVRGIDKPFGNYCSKCGQKLDWSE